MHVYSTPEALLAGIRGRLEVAKARAQLSLSVVGDEIAQDARRRIGTYQDGWPELTPETQAQRVREGYTANDPLERSGELRDAIEKRVFPGFVAVGVPDRMTADGRASLGTIALAMEYGTSTIPPRSFLREALFHSYDRAIAIVYSALREVLG